MNKVCILFIFLILSLKFCVESRKLSNPKSQLGSSCEIDINSDLPDPQPLLINPGTNNSVLPNNPDGIVTLAERQKTELFCTEGFDNKIFGSKSIQASATNQRQKLRNS